MKTVIGVKELLYDKSRAFPNLPNFLIKSWDDINHQDVDVYIQTNQSGGPLSKSGKRYGRLYNKIANTKIPYIVVEGPVFRENHPNGAHPNAYQRWSWLSYYQDEGEYNNKDCPSDRWLAVQKRQNLTVRDWQTSGKHVLIMLQRPGDSSLKNLIETHGDYKNFLEYTISQIRLHTDRPIVIRLHPQRQDRQLYFLNQIDLTNVTISKNSPPITTREIEIAQGGEGLKKDFENCWAVVGFNSNALTESIMYGIPTYSMCSSSMAWPMSNFPLSTIESPILLDRMQWLYNLAYCQWTNEEVQKGLPWFHLESKYNEIKKKLEK